MKPHPVHRLPAPLEGAVQRLKLAARDAVERSIESLGLAALASNNAFQRDGLLGAQFELNRKSAVFVLAFNEAYDQRLLREFGGHETEAPGAAAPTNWAALSLVEDQEVEAQISAERFGLDVAAACEWELRELDAYVAALLPPPEPDAGGDAAPWRNPLRPELAGHALIRGIAAVSDRPEIRKTLTAEISRSLSALLREAYAAMVDELRGAGVQPRTLALRQRRPVGAGGPSSTQRDQALAPDTGRGASMQGPFSGPGGYPGGHGGSGRGGFASTRGGLAAAGGGGRRLGQVDPGLMALIRRLAETDAPEPALGGGYLSAEADAPLHNLIREHRDELRQASGGRVDHMVIDVIGFLFDQILADPKVPPQMARQIARLQLPVLRAALGDPGFFQSRRHPVRRFVNRIASLGAGFDDWADDGAQRFLAKVRALVQAVVEGDFEQLDTYERQLAELEAFTQTLNQQQTRAAVGDAAALLDAKEDAARLAQVYAERLAGELGDLPAPPFLRDFVSGVWSRVMLQANAPDGPESAQAQRLRRAGRELLLSVQPKPTPVHRKAFLAELPQLMQDLTEGLNLIGWPEPERRAFFAQLMPAHAEALKAPGGSALEVNLLAKRVDTALQKPQPTPEEVKRAPLPPEPPPPPPLTAAEAQRVGLLAETDVKWDGRVDIDVDEPAPVAELALPGLPVATDAPDPVQGAELADHVQLGCAYQMQLQDSWQKVKLTHVSAARSFFIFSYGAKQRQTVSLTRRMLQRLAQAGRLRAYEAASLLDRASARARQQLAALAATSRQG